MARCVVPLRPLLTESDTMAEPRKVERAIVLAAGTGSRLVHGEAYPKPLKAISGVPLLVRVLRTLQDEGIREAVIVTGYKGDLLRRALLAGPHRFAGAGETLAERTPTRRTRVLGHRHPRQAANAHPARRGIRHATRMRRGQPCWSLTRAETLKRLASTSYAPMKLRQFEGAHNCADTFGYVSRCPVPVAHSSEMCAASN